MLFRILKLPSEHKTPVYGGFVEKWYLLKIDEKKEPEKCTPNSYIKYRTTHKHLIGCSVAPFNIEENEHNFQMILSAHYMGHHTVFHHH